MRYKFNQQIGRRQTGAKTQFTVGEKRRSTPRKTENAFGENGSADISV